MVENIKKYIHHIEKNNDVKILWAVETGSRAWGFVSTDSDYDIRLIYVSKVDWYLDLSEKKDSIEMMLENNDIDIAGWDLRKACNLLRKSNPALLERIQSSIVYQADDEFIEDLIPIAQSFYSRIATLHHYLSMCKKFYSELQSSSSFKLKSFFYTLRSAMVCKWIVEKKRMPPIEFAKVFRNLNIEDSLVQRIEGLISLKSTIKEDYRHEGEFELMSFIEECILLAESNKSKLPSNKGDLESLNSLFRKFVYKYDN